MNILKCCNCQEKAQRVCVHPYCDKPAFLCDWECDDGADNKISFKHNHNGTRKIVDIKSVQKKLKYLKQLKQKQQTYLNDATYKINEIIQSLKNLLSSYTNKLSNDSHLQNQQLSGSQIHQLLMKNQISLKQASQKTELYKNAMDLILDKFDDMNINHYFNQEYSQKYLDKSFEYYKQSQFEKAISQYQMALKCNPTNTNIYSEFSHLYLKLNDFESLNKLFKQLRKFNKEDILVISYHKKLANICQRYNNHNEAIKQYNNIIKYQPNNHQMYYKRAEKLDKINKKKQADDDIWKCVQILKDMKQKKMHLTYAKEIFKLGQKIVDIDRLEEFKNIFLYRQILTESQISKVQVKRVRKKNTILQCCNCEEKAQRVCVYPNCKSPAFLCDWECDEGLEDIKQFIHTHEGTRNIIDSKIMQKNLKYFKQQELTKINNLMLRIDKITQQLKKLWKRYKQSLQKYTCKVQLNMVNIYEKLFSNEIEQLNGDELNRIYQKSLSKEVEKLKEGELNRINIFQKSKVTQCQQSIFFNPQHKQEIKILSNVMDMILGEIKNVNIELCFNNEYSQQQYALIQFFSTKQQYQKALQYYENVLKYNPFSKNILIYIAECHLHLGNQDDFIKLFKQASKSSNNKIRLIKLRKQLAEVYKRKKMYKQSIKQYNIIINQQPKNHENYYYRGLVQQILQQRTQQKISVEKCIQILKDLRVKNKTLTLVAQIFYLGLKAIQQQQVEEFENIFLENKLFTIKEINQIKRPKRLRNNKQYRYKSKEHKQ